MRDIYAGMEYKQEENISVHNMSMKGKSVCRKQVQEKQINFHACFDISIALYELCGESKI